MMWAGLLALIAVIVLIACAIRRTGTPAEQLQVLIRKRLRDMERTTPPDPPRDDSGFY